MQKLFVITEDVRTMSRFGDYHLRDIIARYISQSVYMHCEKFISGNTVLLFEK